MTAQNSIPAAPATPLSAALLDRFKALVGPKGWSDDPDVIAPHLREPRDLYAGISPLLLRPANTEEVAAIVRLARETKTKLVPQGGNTGLVGGSIPFMGNDEIILSLQRMNRIRAIDPLNDTITVEAGVVLAQVHMGCRRESCGDRVVERVVERNATNSLLGDGSVDASGSLG